jgi:vacuolar-type H+-ATPase subunit I/STV1
MEDLLVYTSESAAGKVKQFLLKSLEEQKQENLKEYHSSYPAELVFERNQNLQDLKARVEKIQTIAGKFSELIHNWLIEVGEEVKEDKSAETLQVIANSITELVDAIYQKLTVVDGEYSSLAQEYAKIAAGQQNIELYAYCLEILDNMQIPFRSGVDLNHFAIILSTFNGEVRRKLDAFLNREDTYAAYEAREINPDTHVAVIITIKKYQETIRSLLQKNNAMILSKPPQFTDIQDVTREVIQQVSDQLSEQSTAIESKITSLLTSVSPVLESVTDLVKNAGVVIQNQEAFEKFPRFKIFKLKLAVDHVATLSESLLAKFRNSIRICEAAHQRNFKDLVPRFNSLNAMTRELCHKYTSEFSILNSTLDCTFKDHKCQIEKE